MSFQKIIEAAKNLDASALKQALKSSRIDVTEHGRPGWLTPAAQLLIDKDRRAVIFLMKHGAKVANIAIAAASIDDRGFLSMLIEKGNFFHASVDRTIGSLIIQMGYISTDAQSQLAYLASYSPKAIDRIHYFINNISSSDPKILVEASTAKHAIAIAHIMHQENLSFTAAFVKADKEFRGILYLLMMACSKKNNSVSFDNFDIWIHIFSFLIDPGYTKIRGLEKELAELDFNMSRHYLSAQLKTYQSNYGLHKERAHSFFKAISNCRNKDEMQKEISQQVQILQGKNPYKLLDRDQAHKVSAENHILDKFHGIVSLWEEMCTGRTVEFEETKNMYWR